MSARSRKGERPRVEVHEYEAGHGFNCDHRSSFDSSASATALARTLAFFEQG